MADILVSTEDFNSYPNVGGLVVFHAAWPNSGDGAVGLRSGSPAPPDASQYIAAGGTPDFIEPPTTWGTDTGTVSRTFTGLTPLAQYRVRWKMHVGNCSSAGVDHFPGAHTYTAGLQANSDRYLVAINDPISVFGPREDAGVPVDAHLFDYVTLNAGFPGGSLVGTIFPALAGWKDYELLTTADVDGHIEITVGKFDGRNFDSVMYFDDITIWLVPPPPPPTFGAPAAVQARGGACYLDSFLEYDGRNVAAPGGLFESVTVELSGGSTWAAGETLTLTALGIVFVSGDVGNVLILHSADDLTRVRFTIAGFTSGTVVTGTANVAIPVSMQSTTIQVWDKAVDQVAGLAHLEQEYVGVFADDHVVGSPNNARITRRRVASGVVQLGDFYTHVFVGLSYLSDLETLDIDSPQGPSLKINKIDITRIGVMLLQSRPAFYGRQPPSNDAVDPLEDLREMPIPSDPTYEVLTSDYSDVNILSLDWNSHGRIFIRSVDPTPHTVLAVVPQGYLPGGS